MKKIIGGMAILLSLFILGGCTGTPKEEIVGTWKINTRSIDITLGEAFPTDLRIMVKGYRFMLFTQQSEANKISFVFKKGGKFIVEAYGDKVNGRWSIKGNNLKLSTTVDGHKAQILLHIDEVESDKFTVSLTAKMVLDQLKSLLPESMQAALSNREITDLLKGTNIKASFKRQ